MLENEEKRSVESYDLHTPQTRVPEGYKDVDTKSLTLVAGESNCIEYVYPREQYQVIYHLNGGTSDKETVETLKYEAEINNYPYRIGYTFRGWYLDENLQTPLTDVKMPARNLNLYAGWNVLESMYVVAHYIEDPETGIYRGAERSYLYANTDSTVEPSVNHYYGYTSPDVKSGIVSAEAPLIIRYDYACNKHTLTLHDAVCEDNISVSDVTVEKKFGSRMPAQIRKNYVFGGWYKDADYTEEYKGMMPDEDLTLYAKWIPEIRSYTFIYQTQASNGRYIYTKVVEGKAQIGSSVTPEGLNFEGFITPDLSPVKISSNPSDNVFYLQYKRKIHTVTFKLGNGENDVIQKYYYDSEIFPPTPKKEGYTFKGWDNKVADKMPDQDLTYTAQWEINYYHIAFMVDNEDIGATYKYGDKIVIPDNPTKEGYTFKGWSGTIPETMPGRNLNLTAVWGLQTYWITYDLDGGTMDNKPYYYTYESNTINWTKDYPVPTKNHYEFLGWSGTGIEQKYDEKGNEVYSKDVSIPKYSTGNRRYVAHWKPVEYEITYISNEVALNIDDSVKKVTYYDTITMPDVTQTLKGYTFKGWSTSLTDKTVRYRAGDTLSFVGRDMTLYAVFEPNEYRVTFDYNNAQHAYSYNEYKYETAVGIPQFDTTDTIRHNWGYNLRGWDMFKSTGKCGWFDIEKSFTLHETEDVKLIAQWDKNNTYLYTPSKADNSYDITDGKDREISFKFYVDGKQTEVPVTGDYGLGNGADYVINMDNMSYDVVSKDYNKIKVNLQCNLTIIHDGYADIRIKYKPKNGDEVSWKTASIDLQHADGITKLPMYELERTDIEYFKIEFDASGGKIDEYLLWNLKILFEYV